MKRILIVLILLSTIFALPVEASVKIGDEVNINGINATVVGFKNGQPVYLALITPDIHSSTSDGMLSIFQNGGLYATARTAANAGFLDNTGAWVYLSNTLDGTYWIMARAYLYFDTSSLNGFVVTAADLKLWGSVGLSSDVDTDSIVIQGGMPTYPHDPLVLGDYDLANYAGNYASKTFATWTDSAYNTLSLNAGGLAVINTAGTTKFCLRTGHDINNNQPTGKNYLWITTTEQGSPYEPTLVVTFTALTPSITSVAASVVGATTARLNSTVADNGGDTTCQIEFGYGTVSKAAVNYAAYTTHTSVTVPKSDYTKNENPYLDVAGLVAGTTYFYRVKITNELASVVSVDEQTFTATATVDDMTLLTGFPNDTSISLSWSKSTGASRTRIRYLPDAYPTSETGADFSTEVYFDTGTSFIHTGLVTGTTYYYSAWGESGGTYSTNEVSMVMTTNSGIVETSAPGGGLPGDWMQDPDETFLVNLEPIYSVINGLADNFDMPRENAWLALSLLFILAIGIGAYIKFSSPSFALGLMIIVMGLFIVIGILGLYMIFIMVIMALGAWQTRPGAGS